MAKEIEILRGLRFTPEMFLKRMEKSKKLNNINIGCKHINTVYSLCWIFQFRVALPVGKNSVRYAGYYAGFDESAMTPGRLARIPAFETAEVDERCVLADKSTEQDAIAAAWQYNKPAMMRKFRVLYAPPKLEACVTQRVYKPMYVFEFHNKELDEKKYRVLDSLTGDLDEIIVE